MMDAIAHRKNHKMGRLHFYSVDRTLAMKAFAVSIRIEVTIAAA